MKKLGCAFICLTLVLTGLGLQAAANDETRFQHLFQDRLIQQLRWRGPTTGPAAVKDRKILFIAEDFSNGGVRGVAAGVRQAVKKIGWNLDILGYSQNHNTLEMFSNIILKHRPDGIILGGSDAGYMSTALKKLKEAGIFIVGWHVGAKPGPIPENHVSVNVTSDPLQVAEIAALKSIIEAEAKAKVVIFTDSRYEIAMRKASLMVQTIKMCIECEVLTIEDVPLNGLSETMDAVAERLVTSYGDRWTHVLGINDLYFDYLSKYLKERNINSDLKMISAGDGSITAFQRIKAGNMQTATVAEPLLLQGWQLVDELNRLFAGENISGYVSDAGLVTQQTNISEKNIYDPDISYRDIYEKIWFAR